MKNIILAYLTVSLLTAGAAQAIPVAAIDFGDAAGTSGGNYTDVNGDTASINGATHNLTDFSTGLDTGWDLNFSDNVANGIWQDAGAGANYTGTKPTEVAGYAATATDDSFYFNSDGVDDYVRMSFSGLQASTEYEFVIYAARGNNAFDSTWNVTTGSPADTGTITAEDMLNNNDSVVTLNAVSTAGGLLAIDWTAEASPGGSTGMSFMEMTQISDPDPEIAVGTVINFNIGEDANGYEAIGNGSNWWNNTAIGMFSNIVDRASNSVADVSITVALDGANSGSGTNNSYADGYVTSPDLDSMTESLVWASGGNEETTVTISGLGANSRWSLDIYAALNLADRSQVISINGGSAMAYNGQAVWGTHAPIAYANVFADPSGVLTVVLDGDDVGGVSYIQGVSLEALEIQNQLPIANPQSVRALPNTPLNITLTGSDPEGSNLTYTVDDSLLVGTLTGATNVWTYTPTNGYAGVDSFIFTVNDGETNSAPATVSITVNNVLPVADTQRVRTLYDTPVAITLTGYDADGPSNLTFSVGSSTTNGVLSGTAPDLTYTPTNGVAGEDSFTFTVNDGFENSAPATVPIQVTSRRPNFIIIFTDDQGYEDLGCFGSSDAITPRIDQMAAEGMKLTSFYMAAAVCTPSRSALMTGSYPRRVNMMTGDDGFGVVLDADLKGLNPDEITIPELLKTVGYKTGMFGKWHLGDQPEFLPTRQGFDEYFGIPYSHDISPFNPSTSHDFPSLPLLDGETVVELDPDADYFTQRFTEKAIEFIEENSDEPFFVYLPHPIPHRPLHMTEPYLDGISAGVSNALAAENGTVNYTVRDGLYYEALREIDWSVGQILDTLVAEGIDDNTIVIFTSDNGQAVQAGSAAPLRGNKSTTWEGGFRVPTVIRWPGQIETNTSNEEVLTSMDLFPTFAYLSGADMPTDRTIDGKNIWPNLTGSAASPSEAFFYYNKNTLEGVRSGKWKLRLGKLYDLETNIGETINVAGANPDIVAQLEGYMTAFQADIATNSRPAGWVDTAHALTIVSSAVGMVGDGDGYDETGAASQGFRSSDVAKSFDAGDSPDSVYGTAGYLFFGDGETIGQSAFANHVNSFPDWVTGVGKGAALGNTPVGVYAGYPPIDNPTETPGAAVADWSHAGHVVANSTGGTWSELLQFTVSTYAPEFRVGIMSGHEHNAAGAWDPTAIRLSVAGGTAGAVTVTNLAILTDTTGMVFFDVTTDGTTADTFSIEAQQRSGGNGVVLTGITFDMPTPERPDVAFSPSFASNTFDAAWKSRAGLTYTLEGSESLTNEQWTIIGAEDMVATPPSNSYSTAISTNSTYFYRLRLNY